MKYAKNVLSLFTFLQIIYLSINEPLFGSENVHIKVHVPEEIPHNFEEVAIIREPENRIKHNNRHKQPKRIRTKLRHKQHNSFLENLLFSDLKTNFDNANIEELTEHLLHTTDEAAYQNTYIKIAPKRPTKYINTYKVVEYKQPVLGKNEYRYYYHQKPVTHTETYKIVESTNQQPPAELQQLYKAPVNTDYSRYQAEINTKPLKLHINNNEINHISTPYDYLGHEAGHTVKNSHNYAEATPIAELLPNTNANLPPYENPASIDIPNLTTNLLLPPIETLTLPIKEAEDFHSDFHAPYSNNADFVPFIGDMYLPVREQSSVAPEATETYTGFDSYSASHVQGIDDQNYSPYRRRDIII